MWRITTIVCLFAATLAYAGPVELPDELETMFDSLGDNYDGVAGTVLPSSIVGATDQEVMTHIPPRAEGCWLNWLHMVAGVGAGTDISEADVEIRAYFGVPWDSAPPTYSVFADTPGEFLADVGEVNYFGAPIYAGNLGFPELWIPAQTDLYIGWVGHMGSLDPTDGFDAVESPISGTPGTEWNHETGQQLYLDAYPLTQYDGVVGGVWGFLPDPGDIDADADVDLDDAALFAGCIGGPNATPPCGTVDTNPEAARSDLDDDEDTDLKDFAEFQQAFGSP